MRYLVTLLLAALSFNAVGQTNPNYNPDYDDDGVIGVSDILGILSTYGDTWDSADVIEITPITNANIHAAVDLWLSDEAQAETTYGHISDWDVSSVTSMGNLFIDASSFNVDISAWDVSSVTSMSGMFWNATSFNGDISSCGDISSWDVSSVTSMTRMFCNAPSFNGDLSSWDVSSVTSMNQMFQEASIFNGDISSWDVSSVTNMRQMFYYTNSFNGDISAWDVSSVTDMGRMFRGASSFNSDLSSWDVSSVTDMIDMFRFVYIFNSDLSSWDVSSVTDMSLMFQSASSFNSDLSSWDVSSVTDMGRMFNSASSFNGYLSSWDVSSVTSMSQMFWNATSFNGDISSWDVSSVTSMNGMFDDASALSEENQCLIHTYFSSNSAWSYDWSEFCHATCGLVSHEGYDYETVLIGEQCWFSENCRYLPEVSSSSASSTTDPYYYVNGYEGTDVASAKSTINYDTYGVLYNWPAVMTEGICPSGWHVPSDGEWQTMEVFLGMSESEVGNWGFRGTDEGYKMKSTSGWNNVGNGSNSCGFTALPGGYCLGGCQTSGDHGYWWSSSQAVSRSWGRSFSHNFAKVARTSSTRGYGRSARCVLDYTDECGVLNGDNSTCADCCGVPYGDGSTCDGECGECNDNSSCLDDCGVLNGDGSTCVFESCGDQIGHGNYAYSTVQIGEQCWFSENCRYLPEVLSPEVGSNIASSTTDPYYYVLGFYDYQGNDVEAAKATENYETYGVLYNWPAVMTEGICPSGWHVPSDVEWTQLTDFLGGESVAGYAMKSTCGWTVEECWGCDEGWYDIVPNGSNSSGFNGLPGGISQTGGFLDIGNYGSWWSAAESGSYSWGRILGSYDDNVDRDDFDRSWGFSARCVRD
jgi:uncharacterized protein (TIGR02145 family)